jgi:hypothetical protein
MEFEVSLGGNGDRRDGFESFDDDGFRLRTTASPERFVKLFIIRGQFAWWSARIGSR